MKNRIIALALVLVMLFALSACGGKDETPAATGQPAAPAAEATAAPSGETAAPAASDAPADSKSGESGKGIEPDSGIYTFTSDANGLSFDFDSKYVAMQNPAGNATVFAGVDEGIPFCTVSLLDKSAAGDAVSYLKSVAEGAVAELGNDIQAKPGEPQKALESRDIYYIYYTYKDKEAGGVVACAYYAENLDSGDVAVYNSLALESDAEVVNSILKLAIETFSIAV